MRKLRLAFAGTPEFASTCLAAVDGAGFDVQCVITQPDRPAGRGRKLKPSAVKDYALTRQMKLWQPDNLRASSAVTTLAALDLDLLIVVAFGQILPLPVLQTPRLGCWNVHASLLPRWRGAAPIHRAILAGDSATGCSIMQMDEGLDTGAVLAMDSVVIGTQTTTGQLHDELAQLGGRALVGCLETASAGKHLVATPQPAEGATYASKVHKSECEIDWSQSAVVIDRKIRALNPWPVAFGSLAGEALRFWDAEPIAGGIDAQPPGTILCANKRGIDLATGDGLLRIKKLQRPGKKPVDATSYLNARPELKT